MFNALINDKDQSIRVILMNHLSSQGDKLLTLIDPKLLTSQISESAKKIFESQNWREKAEVLNNFPNFSHILGKDEFTKVFLDFIKEGFSDRIYEIRKQVVSIVKQCTETFGIEWFEKNLLGYLSAFKSDRNYLHRQTPLFMIQALSKQIGASKMLKKIIEFISEYFEDNVPNIR